MDDISSLTLRNASHYVSKWVCSFHVDFNTPSPFSFTHLCLCKFLKVLISMICLIHLI